MFPDLKHQLSAQQNNKKELYQSMSLWNKNDSEIFQKERKREIKYNRSINRPKTLNGITLLNSNTGSQMIMEPWIQNAEFWTRILYQSDHKAEDVFQQDEEVSQEKGRHGIQKMELQPRKVTQGSSGMTAGQEA